MKNGKELKVENFKNYNVSYGTVNNKIPKAIYINISAWGEPKSELEHNYNRLIKDIDKKIRQSIYNFLEDNNILLFAKERTIVDFDIKESGIKFGKRSFTNCEITLYLKNELSVNSESLKPIIYELINLVIKSNLENCKNFKFYRKKR